jgi:hypothetical protein
METELVEPGEDLLGGALEVGQPGRRRAAPGR